MIKITQRTYNSKNTPHGIRLFLLLNFLIISIAFPVTAQSNWRSEVHNYIYNNLCKSDGGYGWEDQPDSHITPTFAAIGTLNNLGMLPEEGDTLVEFIKTHHPQKGRNKEAGPSGTEMRNLVYQQIQSILWLNGDASDFQSEVSVWKTQAGKLANYERHKYPVMVQEAMIPICQNLIGVNLTDQSEFINYFQTHRRANGSFNNGPTLKGGDGNILNTYWGLYALNVLNAPKHQINETIEWLQNCQLKNGGFTHQPDPQIGINDDVIYTWSGIKALQLLGAKPKNRGAAINYLVSLRNVDGGFGNRSGLHSTPEATYYAIDALKVLNGFAALDKAKAPKPLPASNPDFNGYKVYTAQFEASGSGSPSEAVMIAKELKISLWGAKNPKPNWIDTAQKIADENKVPVKFFVSDEPYGKFVSIQGMGTFEHVLDYIAPGKDQIAFDDSATFIEFKNTTLQALKNANGGLILQVANNEPMARMILDESINSNLGYMAISTIHFGQNFAFWLPYIYEYRYRLPFVTLQDAHGVESWWWTDNLTNHRNLFIAREPTYDALITALKNNWIVAVRHDSISDFETRMLGGIDAARSFIKQNEAEWKWWSDPTHLNRPEVAITVIRCNDMFEVGKPEEGVNIRVRCRWNSANQNLKFAMNALQELKVDGRVVKAEEVILKQKRDTPIDAYYLYKWGTPTNGTHLIEATVRNLKDNTVNTFSLSYIQK